jgi:hypothetical protein
MAGEISWDQFDFLLAKGRKSVVSFGQDQKQKGEQQA